MVSLRRLLEAADRIEAAHALEALAAGSPRPPTPSPSVSRSRSASGSMSRTTGGRSGPSKRRRSDSGGASRSLGGSSSRTPDSLTSSQRRQATPTSSAESFPDSPLHLDRRHPNRRQAKTLKETQQGVRPGMDTKRRQVAARKEAMLAQEISARNLAWRDGLPIPPFSRPHHPRDTRSHRLETAVQEKRKGLRRSGTPSSSSGGWGVFEIDDEEETSEGARQGLQAVQDLFAESAAQRKKDERKRAAALGAAFAALPPESPAASSGSSLSGPSRQGTARRTKRARR